MASPGCGSGEVADFNTDDVGVSAGGGAAAVGGEASGGQAAATGGTAGEGGRANAGGFPAAGGTPGGPGGTPGGPGGTPGGPGGASGGGGLPAAGGGPGSGGAPSPGGMPAAGGAPGVGGSPAPAPQTVSGEVSGEWCGPITIDGQATVPAGQTLTLCAGTVVDVSGGPGGVLRIAGTVDVQGTAEAPVVFRGAGWAGVQVGGTLSGAYLHVSGAEVGLSGLRGGRIALSDADIRDCGSTLSLADGGEFDRLQAVGGGSIRITGGVVRLTDSVVDLQRPGNGPDCLVFSRGGATLEHSHVTGCHCPMHINQADQPISVTYSILDGAAVPVMIANAQGTFHLNHVSGQSSDFDDIGGNIQADIADNYYEGAAPEVSTANPAQFTGADMYRRDPVPGVGPR